MDSIASPQTSWVSETVTELMGFPVNVLQMLNQYTVIEEELLEQLGINYYILFVCLLITYLITFIVCRCSHVYIHACTCMLG